VPDPPAFTDDEIRHCRETDDIRPILFEWYKFLGCLAALLAHIQRELCGGRARMLERKQPERGVARRAEGRRFRLLRSGKRAALRREDVHLRFRGRGHCCFRRPLPCQLLRVGNLCCGHLDGELIAQLESRVSCLAWGQFICRKVYPHVRRHIILGNSFPYRISKREKHLSIRIPLLCSCLISSCRSFIVRRASSYALGEHNPKVHLSVWVANNSGGSNPSQGFDSVLLDPKARSVHHPEICCRPRIALRQRAPYPKRGSVIAALKGTQAVFKWGGRCRSRKCYEDQKDGTEEQLRHKHCHGLVSRAIDRSIHRRGFEGAPGALHPSETTSFCRRGPLGASRRARRPRRKPSTTGGRSLRVEGVYLLPCDRQSAEAGNGLDRMIRPDPPQHDDGKQQQPDRESERGCPTAGAVEDPAEGDRRGVVTVRAKGKEWPG